jgi:Zn-dependent protease
VDPSRLVDVVQGLVILILSLTVHEYAHAWAAFRLGDDTAARLGRLSLNPIVHIDPIGSLLIPAMSAWYGIPAFGWANPVPVNPVRFRRDVSMRAGMAWTAAAGPLSNFALAIIGGIVVRVLVAVWPDALAFEGTRAFLRGMIATNVVLGVFNLLPIPPLDGSRLLPRSMDRFQQFAARWSFLLMMAVIMTPIGTPIWLLSGLVTVALAGPILG